MAVLILPDLLIVETAVVHPTKCVNITKKIPPRVMSVSTMLLYPPAKIVELDQGVQVGSVD